MKKIGIALLSLIVISCGNRVRNDRNTESVESLLAVKDILEQQLKDAIIELAKDIAKIYEIDTSSLSESCFIIQFRDSTGQSRLFFSDSIAIVSYYISDREYPLHEYKGLLEVNNYNIAIFDKNDVGLKYYNADSLNVIPLERFNPIPLNKFDRNSMYVTTPALIFYMRGDTLRYWNP